MAKGKHNIADHEEAEESFVVQETSTTTEEGADLGGREDFSRTYSISDAGNSLNDGYESAAVQETSTTTEEADLGGREDFSRTYSISDAGNSLNDGYGPPPVGATHTLGAADLRREVSIGGFSEAEQEDTHSEMTPRRGWRKIEYNRRGRSRSFG